MEETLNTEKELILEKIITDMVENPFEWDVSEYEYVIRGNLKIKLFKAIGMPIFLSINGEDFGYTKGAEKVLDLYKRLQNKLRVNGINEEIKGWLK